MRSRLLFICILLAVAFSAACQQAGSSAPFKKYADANEVPKISVADAKKEVDTGAAVIVDSRNEIVYKMEHITGSISVPNGSPKEKYDAVPKDKKVIVYCACNGEGTSINLAYQMNQAGFPNTYAMVEGFQGWKTAGYPMTKGE
ncbi:MAG: rhodanese-like domain-containing protein [Acidobacteria bacterium]|nr:rhodanese-like domain-containing protein [Acidobacteriota bacterium]